MTISPSLKNIIFWIVSTLIIATIGGFFRLYPFYHNVTSDAYEKSTLVVLSKIKSSITTQINAQYPNLPSQEKQKLIQNVFDKTLRENKDKVQTALDDLGDNIVKSTDDTRHYLLASDSYYYLELTQNILEKGDVSEKIKGSKFFNPLMLAPLGYWEPQTWHPYLGAFVYRITHFFNPNIDIMTGTGFTSIFLLPLVIFSFIFATRTLGGSWVSIITGGIFFILAPIYLKRSTYGWYDNDTYSILFGFLALGFLFNALKHIHERKALFLYSFLYAITIGLYTKFWYGWGFLWGLSLLGTGAVAFKSLFYSREEKKKTWQAFGILFGLSIAGVFLLYGPKELFHIFSFSLGELQKFTTPQLDGWPDLFLVVGELKKGSFNDIIALTGGPLVFWGALLGLGISFFQDIKNKKMSPSTILLSIILGATITISLNAQRFSLLALIPLSLLFTLMLQHIWNAAKNLTSKTSLKPLYSKLILGLLALILLSSTLIPISTAKAKIRQLLNPIFNSAWEKTLVKINQETSPESIINAWWAPGHFIKAIARRGVLFDGASIKGDIAYWLTQVYLSQSEEEALNILRMLNTSSNQATQLLQKSNIPLSQGVPFLHSSLQLTNTEALLRYNKLLSPALAQELITLTHGKPRPSYIMVYNEIADENIMLGYLGKWNFKKIETLNANPKAIKKLPPKSSKAYIDFIWDLVGWPYRQSPILKPKKLTEHAILFDHNVLIHPSTMEASVDSPQYGKGIPKSIVYIKNGTIVEKEMPQSTLSYSVVLFTSNSSPRCILMERLLANSLLTKLYFLEGKGLKHFVPFSHEQDLTGRTNILTYQILWPES